MKTIRINYLILFVVIISSCVTAKPKDKPLRIALSVAGKNYTNWIHRTDSSIVTIDLQNLPIDSAISLLSDCDGLLLTGGEDIYPGYYGKLTDTLICKSNPKRDSLEFAIIYHAFKMKLPILGICRGEQILNVALGGTLITDIPSQHASQIMHRMADYTKCFHSVNIEKLSKLRTICKTDSGIVTSNHHQAIDKIAPSLKVTAWSTDSIAEAIEYRNPREYPFLIAVQWHPERMADDNRLSNPILQMFIKQCIVYSNLLK